MLKQFARSIALTVALAVSLTSCDLSAKTPDGTEAPKSRAEFKIKTSLKEQVVLLSFLRPQVTKTVAEQDEVATIFDALELAEAKAYLASAPDQSLDKVSDAPKTKSISRVAAQAIVKWTSPSEGRPISVFAGEILTPLRHRVEELLAGK
jgi:hypothetical protein